MGTWNSVPKVDRVPRPPINGPDLQYVQKLYKYIDEMANAFTALCNDLDFMINGNLDVKNIRANSIESRNLKSGSVTTDKLEAGAVTADKIDVNELSAISADLGTITAGLMQAIQILGSIITGSLIQTQTAGNYPRIELNSDDTLLSAEYSATNKLEITPVLSSTPGIQISDGTVTARMGNTTIGKFVIQTIVGAGDIQIRSGEDLELFADGLVRVANWSELYSNGATQTLQQVINSLQSQINSKKDDFTGFSGVIPAGSDIFVSGGIVSGYF